jgi:hypothetical protein
LPLQHFSKEPFSSQLVPSLRHQNVEYITVLIDCAPQIHLLSLDLDEDLIGVPDITQSNLLLSKPAGVLRSELQTPEPNRLIRDQNATLGQQIFDVAKAERESVIKPDGMTDDLGRKPMTSVAWFQSQTA